MVRVRVKPSAAWMLQMSLHGWIHGVLYPQTHHAPIRNVFSLCQWAAGVTLLLMKTTQRIFKLYGVIRARDAN